MEIIKSNKIYVMHVKKKLIVEKRTWGIIYILPHKVTKVAFFMSQCHIE
jgi:hypothetical protein